MKRITKQELDYCIYDMGFEKALQHFNITPEKAELILFGKEERKVKRPGQYVPPKEKEETLLLSPDLENLEYVIEENYNELYQEAQAHISNIIDDRSMSPYDIFAESLKRILTTNSDFHYLNDEQTLAYVRKRIKRTINSEDFRSFYSPGKMPYRDELKSNSISWDIYDPAEELNEKNRQILILYWRGYSTEEIGGIIDMPGRTVRYRLEKMIQQLKTA